MAHHVYPLHQKLNLWAADGSYYIEPTEGGEDLLVISRTNGGISLQSSDKHFRREGDPIKVHGIMGILTLTTTDFLIVITESELKGRLLGHDIYRATGFKVLPIAQHLSATQLVNHPVEKELLALVWSHLYSGTFHFSYTYDLTRRIQAHINDDDSKHMWQTADTRFFWNHHVSTKLMHAEVDVGRFILPVIYGTYDSRKAFIKGKDFQFTLISRRSRFRAGTRYFTRGIDSEGNVGNYNETEQIVTYPDGSRTAIVGIRGSIPLFWAEVNNLRYLPDMQVMERPDQIPAIQTHFKEQTSVYGPVSIVNLVNTHGHEQPVREAYERNVRLSGVKDVIYHHFDFHKECRAMRWDRISILMDMLDSETASIGFLHLDPEGQVKRLQKGVVRTNCMDNLDRTNVVQSSLAKLSLEKQLQEMGYLESGEPLDLHEDFMHTFRNMWADHADHVSIAYSGTGALKTDFTRTGKRTKVGALHDGMNSVQRYFKNNYYDGPRQDAFDLFTGAWVCRGPGSAIGLFADTRSLITRSMPYLCAFAVFMVLAGLTLPRTSNYSLKWYFIFWFSIFLASFFYIRAHGVEYVSWPRLKRIDDVIYYDGPGFRSRKAPKNPMNQAKRGRLTTSKPHKIEQMELGHLEKKRTD